MSVNIKITEFCVSKGVFFIFIQQSYDEILNINPEIPLRSSCRFSINQTEHLEDLPVSGFGDAPFRKEMHLRKCQLPFEENPPAALT